MALVEKLIEAIEQDNEQEFNRIKKIMQDDLPAKYREINAVLREGVDKVKQITDADPLPVTEIVVPIADTLKGSSRKHGGLTPLAFAAQRGKTKFIELLLREAEVSVDVRNNEGETPLMLAAVEGHVEVIQKLRLKGADPHARDSKGMDVLCRVISQKNLEEPIKLKVLKAIHDPEKFQVSETKASAEIKLTDQDRNLLKAVDFNKTYNGNNTLLDLTAIHNLPLLTDFIVVNSNPGVQVFGHALELAAAKGNLEVVKLILKKTKKILTLEILHAVIYTALVHNQANVIALLLRVHGCRNIDFNKPTPSGKYLLQIAENTSWPQVKKFLDAQKIKPRLTSFEFAVYMQDYEEVEKMLREPPKDLNLEKVLNEVRSWDHTRNDYPNQHNNILIYVTAVKEDLKMLQLLLGTGSKFEIRHVYDALMDAALLNRFEQVTLLLQFPQVLKIDFDTLPSIGGRLIKKQTNNAAKLVQDFILKRDFKLSDLEFAVYKNNVPAVQKLLDEKESKAADKPNEMSWKNAILKSLAFPGVKDNRRCLNYAIEQGYKEIASILYAKIKDSLADEDIPALHNIISYCVHAHHPHADLTREILQHPLAKKIDFSQSAPCGLFTLNCNGEPVKLVKEFWYTRQFSAFEQALYKKENIDAWIKPKSSDVSETKLQPADCAESKTVSAEDLLTYKEWPLEGQKDCPISWALRNKVTTDNILAMINVAWVNLKEGHLGHFIDLAIDCDIKILDRLLEHPNADKIKYEGVTYEHVQHNILYTGRTDSPGLAKIRDVQTKKEYKWDDLDLAVYKNDVARVKKLLEVNNISFNKIAHSKRWPKQNTNKVKQDDAFTLLTFSAFKGHLEVLKLLWTYVLNNASQKPQVLQPWLTNLLIFSTIGNHTECFKFLLAELEKLTNDLDAGDMYDTPQKPSRFLKDVPALEKIFKEAQARKKAEKDKTTAMQQHDAKKEVVYLKELVNSQKALIKKNNIDHKLGQCIKEPSSDKGSSTAEREPVTEIQLLSQSTIESKQDVQGVTTAYQKLVTQLRSFTCLKDRKNIDFLAEDKLKVENILKILEVNPKFLHRLAHDPEKQLLPRLLAQMVIYDVMQPKLKTQSMEARAPNALKIWKMIKDNHYYDALFLACDNDNNTVLHYAAKGENDWVVNILLNELIPVAPWGLLIDVKHWFLKINEPQEMAKGSIKTAFEEKRNEQKATLLDLWRYYQRIVRDGIQKVPEDVKHQRMALRYIAVAEILKFLWKNPYQNVQERGSWVVNIQQHIQAFLSLAKDEISFGDTFVNILQGLARLPVEELQKQAELLKNYLLAQHPKICEELRNKWNVALVSKSQDSREHKDAPLPSSTAQVLQALPPQTPQTVAAATGSAPGQGPLNLTNSSAQLATTVGSVSLQTPSAPPAPGQIM